MKEITSNFKENKKDLLVVLFIELAVTAGCYLLIPKLFS